TIERKPGNILTRRGIFLPTPFNFAASCATVAPMIAYAAQRLASLFLTLVAATVIIFLVLEVLPGDPAEIMLGLNAQPDTVAALRHELGLDRPALIRYLDWVGGFLNGDLGVSYTYSVPVSELVAERAAVSLPLAVIALLL